MKTKIAMGMIAFFVVAVCAHASLIMKIDTQGETFHFEGSDEGMSEYIPYFGDHWLIFEYHLPGSLSQNAEMSVTKPRRGRA